MIYVVTSITNGFDNLRPPATPADHDVRYVCFTNIPNLPHVHPWEFRPLYAINAAPSRSSRLPKILPHLMLPADAEYSIYHDGNFQLREDPHRIIGDLLNEHDWAAYRHPARSCIYDEAVILLREGIGTERLVKDEIARHRAAGYPERNGLWANGFIVRRHTQKTVELNEAWWKLYSEGCERDQISFPVARHAASAEIRTIHGDIYSSGLVLFRWHAAWKERDGNPDYIPERRRIRDRLNKLRELAGPATVDYADY